MIINDNFSLHAFVVRLTDKFFLYTIVFDFNKAQKNDWLILPTNNNFNG